MKSVKRSVNYRSLPVLEAVIPGCRRCPELRSYCRQIANSPRPAFGKKTYWARPVPGFGDHRAEILVLGLAPAAHGANRTGRLFTGDRSGDFLFAALHRTGLASQPDSVDRDDGLSLRNVYVSAAIRCAPPANRPTPGQLAACAGFLREEVVALKPAVILCLGEIAWKAALATLAALELEIPRPRPRFAHGAEVRIESISLLACYHVSQQNTFTGRLTVGMIDVVVRRAVEIAAQRARASLQPA